MIDSSLHPSDCEDDPAEGAALNEVTQSICGLSQLERLCYDDPGCCDSYQYSSIRDCRSWNVHQLQILVAAESFCPNCQHNICPILHPAFCVCSRWSNHGLTARAEVQSAPGLPQSG